MKFPAITLAGVLLLTVTSYAQAGDSYVNVNIQNDINSASSYFSQFKTQTKINISQSGEGTSSVSVNGKEWKLEGPGDINVNESSSQTSIPDPTQNPISNPEPTEDVSVAPSEALTPTDNPDNNEENLITLSEMIREKIEEIRESLQEFFFKYF